MRIYGSFFAPPVLLYIRSIYISDSSNPCGVCRVRFSDLFVTRNLNALFPITLRSEVSQRTASCGIQPKKEETKWKTNRAEAKNVSIYEYDQEKHLRQEREAAWEDGRKNGWENGRKDGWTDGHAEGLAEGLTKGEQSGKEEKVKELIQKKILKGKTTAEIAEALEEEETEILRLIEEMQNPDF